jgi:hypothetical protein
LGQARAPSNRLEAENEALRSLAIKLGRIVLTSASNPCEGAHNIRMPIFDGLAPDQVVSALRELALECERLVRIANLNNSVQEFEAIGIEFADTAVEIEAAFRIPPVAS